MNTESLIKNIHKFESDIEGLNSSLETKTQQLENLKATKQEVDVERKRIDSFTKLAEGSTTGDAELIDARIGIDAVSYQNVGNSIRHNIGRIINTNKIIFNVGLPDNPVKNDRCHSNIIYLKKGDIIETKSPYHLTLWYFDEQFDQPGQEIDIVEPYAEKIIIKRTGNCMIIGKKTNGDAIGNTDYVSSNTIIVNSNTNFEEKNYTERVEYVYGSNSRTTGQYSFDKGLISSDRFYELNGELLSIISGTEFFVILFDQNLKILGDSFSINGNRYTTKWIYNVKTNYPSAKYIRIIAQSYNQLNVTTKIINGITKKEYQPNVILSASNSTSGNKSISEFVCNGVDDREIIQQAMWLSYARNSKVILCEGDYILNSIGDYDGNKEYPNKTCLWFNNFPNSHQYANTAKMFCIEGMTQGISFTTGARILLGTELYNKVGSVGISMIRSNWQAGFDVEYGVSAIRMRNLTWVLPMNDKPITCVDLGFTHACDLDDVKCIAVKPEEGYGHLKTPPIAHSECYGIRGLLGSNWNVVNTFKNIEALGFYIGFDISGEHCSVINASAKYCYYGFTFCHLQRYGANHHPITCINMLDEHSVCMPLFGKEGYEVNQGIIIYGYNLMFPSWCTQGDIPAVDSRHHKARELGSDNGFGGVIYYSNNTTKDGQISNNQYHPAFFEQGGKAIKCVNMAHKQAHSTTGRKQLEPNYMQEVFDITLNKKVIWNGTIWIDVNGNPVD